MIANEINNYDQQKITIFKEALSLFHCLEAVSKMLEKQVQAGNAEELEALLNQRQDLMTEIDGLKTRGGLNNWTELPNESSDLTSDLAAIIREISAVLERLALQDQRIKKDMQVELNKIKSNIKNMRQSKQANRIYQGGAVISEGIFLDSKR